eukprot:190326-Karenia_brevis.AAC.1
MEVHQSLYFQWIKPQMPKIRTGQEIASRMINRKHMVQQAGEALGVEGISMSSAAAVSEGPSPYYAPGMGIPYDGLSAQEAPQGLRTRGFKREVEFSE